MIETKKSHPQCTLCSFISSELGLVSIGKTFIVEDKQLEISVYGVQKLIMYITNQIISIFLRIVD